MKALISRIVMISLTCVSLGLGSVRATAAEIHVAAASNFTAPLEKLSALFSQATGHKLIISYGSTGKFFSQIVNGASFEVFLAADQEHPRLLIQNKQAVAGTQSTYAIGKLVLWSPHPKEAEPLVEVLKKGEFKHLSMANPKLAPYGLAAKETLEKMNLWEKDQSRIVLGENITQAYQFVATGNAELGFVALSQVKQVSEKTEGSMWIVPQSMYSTIKQDAVLLEKGKANPAAKEFLKFLRSDPAKDVIKKFGYELP